ncbi:MAG: hypothetical protein Tsb0021_10680 [Chlamydiales bacterium]
MSINFNINNAQEFESIKEKWKNFKKIFNKDNQKTIEFVKNKNKFIVLEQDERLNAIKTLSAKIKKSKNEDKESLLKKYYELTQTFNYWMEYLNRKTTSMTLDNKTPSLDNKTPSWISAKPTPSNRPVEKKQKIGARKTDLRHLLLSHYERFVNYKEQVTLNQGKAEEEFSEFQTQVDQTHTRSNKEENLDYSGMPTQKGEELIEGKFVIETSGNDHKPKTYKKIHASTEEIINYENTTEINNKIESVKETFYDNIQSILMPDVEKYKKVMIDAKLSKKIYETFEETAGEYAQYNFKVPSGYYKVVYPVELNSEISIELNRYNYSTIKTNQFALQRLRTDQMIEKLDDGKFVVTDNQCIDQLKHFLEGVVKGINDRGRGLYPEIGIMLSPSGEEIFVISPLAVGSLEDILKTFRENGALTKEVQIELMRQVIDCVKELNLTWGDLHHDIDPSNFLVVKDPNNRFGLRIYLADRDYVTKKGDLEGSLPLKVRPSPAPLEYVSSPEAENYFGDKYDVYGVGNILWEIFDNTIPVIQSSENFDFLKIRKDLKAKYFVWERFDLFIQVMIKGLQHPDPAIRFDLSQAAACADKIQEHFDNKRQMLLLNVENKVQKNEYRRLRLRNLHIEKEFKDLDKDFMEKNEIFIEQNEKKIEQNKKKIEQNKKK